ncbi:homeo-like domain protein [Lyngbya aestuarii BL J]|uniref:Homeo-like domain protein n=1 Tax=Lyngbya aestuarii BL J TaxID=1348334 RepID=U7QI91_9CYAN|nr:helix-turn-helix domain-containing protein [Lyngbya aestuarii]ERT06977.1 homeo-like domain protein [Lyngbya aestuarii BL J]
MDQQIQDLIEQLQQFEHTSSKGRKALTRLLIIIQGHPDLYRSSHRDYSEALNRTLEWVCKNIQSFEPRPPSIEQSLIRWINGYLKWRVRDLFTTNHTPSLDRPISNKEGESTTLMDRLEDPNAITNLEGWIEQTQKERRLSIGDTVWEYIEKDPENLLKNCYPKKQPECHCQILAIRLLLQQPPHKISEIAREYNISNQTLYSHWKRKCLPLLQTIGDQISKRFGLEK